MCEEVCVLKLKICQGNYDQYVLAEIQNNYRGYKREKVEQVV